LKRVLGSLNKAIVYGPGNVVSIVILDSPPDQAGRHSAGDRPFGKSTDSFSSRQADEAAPIPQELSTAPQDEIPEDVAEKNFESDDEPQTADQDTLENVEEEQQSE
jgi:hypothetical protein